MFRWVKELLWNLFISRHIPTAKLNKLFYFQGLIKNTADNYKQDTEHSLIRQILHEKMMPISHVVILVLCVYSQLRKLQRSDSGKFMKTVLPNSCYLGKFPDDKKTNSNDLHMFMCTAWKYNDCACMILPAWTNFVFIRWDHIPQKLKSKEFMARGKRVWW